MDWRIEHAFRNVMLLRRRRLGRRLPNSTVGRCDYDDLRMRRGTRMHFCYCCRSRRKCALTLVSHLLPRQYILV
eukprot:9730791-Alexandrium_andersonii.AAC.1